MADLVEQNRTELAVPQAGYSPSVRVLAQDIVDYDTPTSKVDRYVNVCIDRMGQRLRLQVHQDGSWLLEEYSPEEDIPGDKEFQIVAGNLDYAFDTARYSRVGVRKAGQ